MWSRFVLKGILAAVSLLVGLMFQDFLPLSIQGDWRTASTTPLRQNLSQWLYEPGSLTQKLKSGCQSFKVKILAKSERLLTKDEALLFACEQQKVQVREVLLYCDDLPHVYAQSLMPLKTVPPSVKKLTTLGEKPLGEVIFNEPGMTRSEIEVCPFDQNSDVAVLAERIGLGVNHTLWGRRSCFHIDGYALLVSEVFLPDARAYR